MRTRLDPAWLDSLAFACLHYQELGGETEVGLLIDRLYNAAHLLDDTSADALADLAEAVATRVSAAYPQGSTGLEFRNLDTGEPIDPNVFIGSEDGAASVWAARLCSAAMSRDEDSVQALIAVLRERRHVLMMIKSIRMLLIGASGVLNEAGFREQWSALEAQALTGAMPDYLATCHGGGPLGYGAHPEDAPLCWSVHSLERGDRDRAAAFHVVEHGHTITLKEE